MSSPCHILRDLLTSAQIDAGATLTATRGVNGNGGLMADIADLLAAEPLEDYAPAEFDPDKFSAEWSDASTTPPPPPDGWLCFIRAHLAPDGVLTGLRSVIYVYVD